MEQQEAIVSCRERIASMNKTILSHSGLPVSCLHLMLPASSSRINTDQAIRN